MHPSIARILRQPPLASFRFLVAFLAFVGFNLSVAEAQQKKPNILVIWGDDIGNQNISFNSHGLMGYQTPNIDRIAKGVTPQGVLLRE